MLYFGVNGDSGSSYSTVFTGEAKAEPWAQAVSLMATKDGGSFNVDTKSSLLGKFIGGPLTSRGVVNCYI